MTVTEFEKYVSDKVRVFLYDDKHPYINSIVSKRFESAFLIDFMISEYINNNDQPIDRIAAKAVTKLYTTLIDQKCNYGINSKDICLRFVEMFK